MSARGVLLGRHRVVATGAVALGAALLLAAGCGGGDGDEGAATADGQATDPTAVLADVEAAMGGLDRGRFDLALRASAGGDDPTGPVGFRVAGDYSYAEGGPLAVLDLEATDLFGDDEVTTRITSTGEAVFVEAGGEVTEVDAGALDGLQLGDGGGGVADLGVAGWVVSPVLAGAGDSRTITGEVDVADLLGDLGRLGAEVSGEPAPTALDDDDADQLRSLVRASGITIEVGPDDLPRSLEAFVDFGAEVPPALVEALGRYASARLELTLSLSPLDDELVVEAPGGAG